VTRYPHLDALPDWAIRQRIACLEEDDPGLGILSIGTRATWLSKKDTAATLDCCVHASKHVGCHQWCRSGLVDVSPRNSRCVRSGRNPPAAMSPTSGSQTRPSLASSAQICQSTLPGFAASLPRTMPATYMIRSTHEGSKGRIRQFLPVCRGYPGI